MALITNSDKQWQTPDDICAHVGDDYAQHHGAIVPPIYQNSLFVQDGANGPYTYSREANPTVEVAERKIAALEGAQGALCFASGMAAISSAILHFVRAGSHLVMVGTAYGPTRRFAAVYLKERLGVETTFVNGSCPQEIFDAVRENTRLIYLESPSSLVFHMQDLDAVSAFAHSRGIGTVIDNTYATPLHQQPLLHGIDISCHTASKYMGGHSDIVAGALAASAEIVESIRKNERELFGACMDPHQAWLLARGLRTLPVRLKRHGESGKKVAAYLESRAEVVRVNYPGSATYPQKELFARYLTGTNGLLSFQLRATPEQVRRFVASLRVFQRGVSWGGFESLAWPVSLDATPGPERPGAAPDGVRLHVGLEEPSTLIADLEQAFASLRESV